MIGDAKRRVHSTIDRLPEAIRAEITSMIVDGEWPEDWQGQRAGKPTYWDVVAHVEAKGHNLSRSAVCRYAQRVRTFGQMKETAELVRRMTKDRDGVAASETQRAAAEMVTAAILNVAAESTDLSTRDMKGLAEALKDCTLVVTKADAYIRQQVEARVQTAAKAINGIARKRQIDPETLRMIREQVYGIVDDKLGFTPEKAADKAS